MPHAFGAFQSVDGGDTILGSMLLTFQSCQLIDPIFSCGSLPISNCKLFAANLLTPDTTNTPLAFIDRVVHS